MSGEVHHFGWFSYDADRKMLTMPHLKDKEGVEWRVNHCPACGANVRNCDVDKERVMVAYP